MSFWTGTHWERDDPPPPSPSRPSRARHLFEAVTEGALVALLVVGLVAGSAFAAQSGNGKGKGGVTTTSVTFTASPDVLLAGDVFNVSGCSFDTSLGNVVVGFTGGSWGSPLDAAGCFTITGIPALSGDTLAPGTYPVTAYQNVNGRWKAVATTTVTIVSG